ncbi:MAG: hypothetical protein LW875_07230 [Proteobacteria bacterium]|jgi:hypothetical protein|nr:hypothetical protein [Pseudomonadota bacterium]
MAKESKPTPHNTEKQVPNNVIPLHSSKCNAEGCKAKPSRASFCEEHYTWFKEGLITLQGDKAKDFDKKYHAFMRRKSA